LKWLVVVAAIASLTACASAANVKAASPAATTEDTSQAPAVVADDQRIVFPTAASQGALVFGKVPAGSIVRYAGRVLRPTP
jgi:hypothetical protein